MFAGSIVVVDVARGEEPFVGVPPSPKVPVWSYKRACIVPDGVPNFDK